MTADVCSDNGKTFTANTSSSLSTYTINYYTESLNGTGTLKDGTYYNKDARFSQTLQYSNASTWGYKSIDGFTPATSTSATVSNKTANLYYKRNRNNVAFYDNYGTQTASISNVMYEMPFANVTYNGQAISSIKPAYPASLEKGAYEFGGWYTTKDCYPGTEANFTNGIMPNGPVSFYAKWVPVTHTVTIEGNGTQKVGHGALATKVADPTNGNMTFVGWFYKENGKEKAFDFDTTPINRDITIYAKWTSTSIVDYTINYQLEDGTTIAESTTGQALGGTTKTFEAKVAKQLAAEYQEGFFNHNGC